MPQATARNQRRRQSLHFSNITYEELDQAYKKAAHWAYPKQLEKAPFIEAIIAFGVAHLDKVTARALEIQDGSSRETT